MEQGRPYVIAKEGHEVVTLNRRGFIAGLFAPAIIRTAGLLMPIRPLLVAPPLVLSANLRFIEIYVDPKLIDILLEKPGAFTRLRW